MSAVFVNNCTDAVFRCCLLEVYLFPIIKMAVPQVFAGSREDRRDSAHVLAPEPAWESYVCQSMQAGQASFLSLKVTQS